jgi:hypothetical protein
MRLGERVQTPKGSGLIVGFGRLRPGWDGVWQADVEDPVLGPLRMVSTEGPFVSVLIGNQVLPVPLDDIGLAPTKAVYPGLFEVVTQWFGGDREL